MNGAGRCRNKMARDFTSGIVVKHHQRQRHEFWMQKYPNRPGATVGPPLTDIENARPETKALSKPPVDLKKLPFDPIEILKQPLPWTDSDSGR